MPRPGRNFRTAAVIRQSNIKRKKRVYDEEADDSVSADPHLSWRTNGYFLVTCFAAGLVDTVFAVIFGMLTFVWTPAFFSIAAVFLAVRSMYIITLPFLICRPGEIAINYVDSGPVMLAFYLFMPFGESAWFLYFRVLTGLVPLFLIPLSVLAEILMFVTETTILFLLGPAVAVIVALESFAVLYLVVRIGLFVPIDDDADS